MYFDVFFLLPCFLLNKDYHYGKVLLTHRKCIAECALKEILPRNATLAQYMLSLYARPSVCPSHVGVPLNRLVTQTTTHNSSEPLSLMVPKILAKFVSLNVGGAKCRYKTIMENNLTKKNNRQLSRC